MKLWKKLLHRRRLQQDLDDELRFHLEMKAQAQGGPDQARQSFGNLTATKEALHDMWTFPSLESWWSDIRYATRSLAATPGFTVVAVVALALGIGADTAIFTIIKGAFTWNLGLDHIDRIMWITAANADAHTFDWAISYPDFRDYRARAKSLEGVAAYRFSPSNIAYDKGLPERMSNAQVSGNSFAVSEYTAAMGRTFVDSDEAPGALPAVILAHHVWRDKLGADEAIIGKVIRVDEIPRTIVGVMPPYRRFPEETDIWTPLVPSEKREDHNLILIGRLPENANIAGVKAELQTIAASLAAAYPATNKNMSATLRPIAEITAAYGIRPLFSILFAAVGFVLLIACADVANMLLARGAGRTREMAIRVAIGAGRARIFRQLLVESLVLSAVGGLCGWLVALGGIKWFDVGVTSLNKPAWMDLSIDRWAFVYLASISIGAGLISGLAPACRVMLQTGVSAILKDGGHGSVGGRAFNRLSSALVVFQMILCVVLLAAAGLMIRSANKLYSAAVGVTTANILTSGVNLPAAKYRLPSDRLEFQRVALAQVEALPGVTAAAMTASLPLGGWDTLDAQLQGEAGTQRLSAIVVTPSYFQVFDLKSLAGRVFTGDDSEVVVNQSFAVKYWPNESAIGKRLRLAGGQWLTVAGVVPDVLQNTRDRLLRQPLFYLAYTRWPNAQMNLVARTAVPPETLANPLRAAIQKIDLNLPLLRSVSLQSRLDSARLEVTVFGSICSVFAGIALILATVGLYSVIAHSVNRRAQEIGLRMAMGGTPRDILTLVFRQGLRPLLIGLVLGVPLSMAAMRALSSSLVGVAPTDPLTFSGVVLLLLAAGILGCVIPARRATRVDPVVALRCQ